METSHCEVCGQESTLVCSACRKVCYCSKQHQTSHWKEHKPNCSGKAYKIEGDVNTDGYHLVASKDLEAGSFILQEQPLMTGPKQRKPEDKKVCLGCYEKVAGRGVDCPGCKWPMCGKKVCWEEGSEHALGECALLKGARERLPANYLNLWDPGHVYQSLTVLRFLSLRERDPSKWRELMSLKLGISSMKLNGMNLIAQTFIVPIVNKYLLNDPVPEEWIIKLITLLSSSTLFLPALKTLYVYSLGCLFDHSCMANAEHTFTKSGKMLVRSTLPIAKGSKITLNYSKNVLWGTRKRLESLVMSRFMGKCQCYRCRDPTELQTYTSGIFCPRCPKQEGILLPQKPQESESSWACNKCSAKKSAAFIAQLLENEVIQLDDRARSMIPDCNSFIQKYETVLHPNHYMLTDIKMMLCHASACDPATRYVIPELDKTEAEILKLLELVKVISPGMSKLRGKLLSNLASTKISRLCTGVGFTPDENVISSKLEVLLETAREAYKILYWGPEETIEDEHLFADAAHKECVRVETILGQWKDRIKK